LRAVDLIYASSLSIDGGGAGGAETGGGAHSGSGSSFVGAPAALLLVGREDAGEGVAGAQGGREPVRIRSFIIIFSYYTIRHNLLLFYNFSHTAKYLI
jgi:hypothetical protein